jgi:predicted chitinase
MQKQVQNIILEMTDDQFSILLAGQTMLNLLFNTHPALLVKESHAEAKLKIGMAVAKIESESGAMTSLNNNLNKMVEGIMNQKNI